MKRIAIHISVFLLAIALGMLAEQNLSSLKKSNKSNINLTPANLKESLVLPVYPSDMLDVTQVSNEPVKIVNIRLAEEDSATSDMLIDVENVSSKAITYIIYILAPFNDCPGVGNPGSPTITFPDPLTAHRFLKPQQRTTLIIPGRIYEGALHAQQRWNCPRSAKLGFYLYSAGFNDETWWERQGPHPEG